MLFTFVAGLGHFEPLVPIAVAAKEAGHSVAFGCSASLATAVGAAGFRVFPIEAGAGTGANGHNGKRRTALRPLDSEREDRDLRERFARGAAGYRVPRIRALCEKWQPDVLVCDETDFGALVACECLGLPFASVLVIVAGSFVRKQVIAGALGELRAEHGLPPDPELEMLSRYLVLSPVPARYRDPAHPLPATAHGFRPLIPGRVGDLAPAWASGLPGAPRVYFTLGTAFNRESGDLIARVLAGLRELPCNLVATVGPGIDPEEFSPQPANVHIERHIPQSSVLPHCDLVVSHGGSGSVIGALAHGLPSILIPIGADQPHNAARCST